MNKISRILLVAVIISCLFAGVAAAKKTVEAWDDSKHDYVRDKDVYTNNGFFCHTNGYGKCERDDNEENDEGYGYYQNGNYQNNCIIKASMKLTKSASSTTYTAAGQTIIYTYVINNTGTAILERPFNVSDNKTPVTCPNTPSVLAPGANITCTASYSVTDSDITNGSITNTANATAYNNSELVQSKKVKATVTLEQIKTIELTKSAYPLLYTAAGQIISYSYLIENTGNVNLWGPFKVSDNKTTVTCPNTPSLAPGDIITCIASYTVTDSDITNGSIINTAKATTNNTAPTNDNCNSHNPIYSNVATAIVTWQSGGQIPEFPTIALPIAATLGLLFVMRRKI